MTQTIPKTFFDQDIFGQTFTTQQEMLEEIITLLKQGTKKNPAGTFAK